MRSLYNYFLTNLMMSLSLIENIAYLELYVFNAFQAVNFYKNVLGFKIMAYGGPETGLKDRISYIIKQGNICIILTSSLDKNSFIYKHVITHDEGVKDIAFLTHNVKEIFHEAKNRGALYILEPTEISDGSIKITKASIRCFGDTIHSFINFFPSNSCLPFYCPVASSFYPIEEVGLQDIDHIAIAVEKGSLNKMKAFYENMFGFYISHVEDVYTSQSGMRSLVMTSSNKKIKFPLVEPAPDTQTSQIDKFLSYYGCSGVQHVAFLSDNVIKTSKNLKKRGLTFLTVPSSYYAQLSSEIVSVLSHKMEDIQELGVLVDKDKEGMLMQVFSKPLQTLPTFFIEIIQRENTEGFGSKNIKALFEAVEREQKLLDTAA